MFSNEARTPVARNSEITSEEETQSVVPIVMFGIPVLDQDLKKKKENFLKVWQLRLEYYYYYQRYIHLIYPFTCSATFRLSANKS